MARWLQILALAVLALAWGGCSTKNKVAEEDREGIAIAAIIDQIEDAELDRLESALAEHPELKPTFEPVVARIRVENADRLAIHNQLLDNFGQPTVTVTYNHGELPGLLERMKKAHSAGFWAAMGAAILSGGAIALGIARSPLARMIPGFGPVFSALDTTLGGIEAWMQKKKASGEGLQASDLAEVLELAHDNKNVGAFIDAKLGKIKAVMGTDPVKLIGQAAVDAAAPSSAPAAPAAVPSDTPVAAAAATPAIATASPPPAS